MLIEVSEQPSRNLASALMVKPDMRDRGAVLALPLLLSACAYQHYQSTFTSAAVEARQFNSLFVIFLAVCGVMYLLVIAALLTGLLRRRRAEENTIEDGSHDRSSRRLRSALIGWGALIGIALIALSLASFIADRSMARAAADPKLSVTITANQWWWDIQYNASDRSRVVRTANELHLPVGVPVRILLRSNDVIHSFWVPSLAGKEDLIPGRVNDISITPTKTGIYRGQCAEFCGIEHARMALVVDVDAYGDFIRWWEHQLEPAPPPPTALTQAGYAYVTARRCSSCHTIRGTPAHGAEAPDLTHLASRRSIAAGTMPMKVGNLYGWVANSQALKPGTSMPASGLEPDQLHAVVAYLETLK